MFYLNNELANWPFFAFGFPVIFFSEFEWWVVMSSYSHVDSFLPWTPPGLDLHLLQGSSPSGFVSCVGSPIFEISC
jgi:hypothetical protein